MHAEETLIDERGNLAVVTLNRPKALNALTLGQFRTLRLGIEEWSVSSTVDAVAIRSNLPKAFCAGGDLRGLWDHHHKGDEEFLDHIYREEYSLNYEIATFGKPWIACMDGIVMGGGAGVAVHGSHRLVTERTRFAMPEVAIGYVPDVGASHFLPRCPGALGTYLGLTGASAGPGDVIAAGLADAFVPSRNLPALLDALAEGTAPNDAVARFAEDAPAPELGAQRALIDRCFTKDTVADIFDALTGETDAFASETLALLQARPPLSLCVTLEMLRRGAKMDLADCLAMEFTLSQTFCRGEQFFEGIRTVIIDKGDTPRWSPSTLDEVTDDMVASMFEHPAGVAPLVLGELDPG